jgi:predicted nucleic acid-binding Zn ribbon protein
MSDEDGPRLSPTARQVLGKTRIPHKFCPYCGTRNEANAEVCESCGKNIAWMKVPEPIPYTETPKQKPRMLPEQRKAFSRKTLIIILIILALIAIVILVLILTVDRGKGATAGFPLAGLCLTGLILPSMIERGWKSGRFTKGVTEVAVPVLRKRGPRR